MQHEPSRLLRHVDIAGEGGACDALLVRRDEPDSHQPLLHRNLRILKDRADLDREPLAAVAALMSALV